ncbi:MAG: ACP S-malonyltransferase [bacterium]|nr:ACP S-malonyltransferase [bacterium]
MEQRSTVAWVFPGQGSQVVGMGKDLAASYPAAREVFQQADDLLGFQFSALCFDGPQRDLDETINTQPALYVCGIATLWALQSELPELMPVCTAGHSLGEFTALTAAGALTFEDGLRLVRERGRLMKEAGERAPGGMAALLGLEIEAAQAICQTAAQQTGTAVVVANDNCPGQVVISGEAGALERAMTLAKEAGAKRTIRLAVSIAAHSPLMEAASAEFQARVAGVPLTSPLIPVYGNVEAAPLLSVEAIRSELNRQLTQTVCWSGSVRAMRAAGVTHFLELGPGDVLTGLLKRIDRDAQGTALNSAAALEKLAAAL